MSVVGAKTVIRAKETIKGIFLLYDCDNKSVTIEELPAGVQKSMQFKLRFKVENKTAERKITVYSKTFKGGLKEAISRKEDFINNLRNGTLEETRIRKLTLDDAMEEYLEYKGSSIKPRTLEYYKQTYGKWLKPKLGQKYLKNITQNDLQSIVNSMLKQGMAPRTTQSIKQITRPLFKHFADKGIINGNPASLIKIPKFDNTVHVTLSQDEITRLYKEINRYDVEPFHTLFMWLAEGRRLNELLSLEWNQINLNNNTYSIASKNNKAGVSMQYRLRDNIAHRLEDFSKQSKFVFHALKDTSKQMTKETVRGHWAKLLKLADIEQLRIHDLRHILGSDLVSHHHTLEEIAQVLGHTSTSVTKRYSKVREEKATEALESFFSRIDETN